MGSLRNMRVDFNHCLLMEYVCSQNFLANGAEHDSRVPAVCFHTVKNSHGLRMACTPCVARTLSSIDDRFSIKKENLRAGQRIISWRRHLSRYILATRNL